MGNIRYQGVWVLGCVLILVLSNSSAWALPQFARKYNVSCTLCHAAIPRLNEYGFKFRALGFRTPNEIGEDLNHQEKTTLENYLSVIGAVGSSIDYLNDQGANSSTITERVSFLGVSIHPFTAAWGKSWGTNAELTIGAAGKIDVEQTHARFLFGESETSFGSIRAGVFHAFEGFGSGDQPIGISRPLLLSRAPSRGSTEALYTYFDPSAAGVNLNYWLGNTYFNFMVLNRLGPTLEDGGVAGSYLSDRSIYMGDFALSLTHIYDEKGSGSGVSLSYYHGQSTVPTDSGAFAAAGVGSTYNDPFQRLSLLANYFLTTQWEIFGGVGIGRDQDSSDANLDSFGYFLGLQSFWKENLAMGIRFDQYRGDVLDPQNISYSAAIFTNYLVIPQLQIVGEYQFLRTGRSGLAPRDENIFTVKMAAMY